MTLSTGAPVLDEVLAAAQVVVDNMRSGPTCCYGVWDAHVVGTNKHCAVCGLHNALTAFAESQAEQ